MKAEILQPIAILAGWTMIMWLWMYVTRVPAMQKVPGLNANTMVGGVGKDLDAVLPSKIQWIAHNYNHLHEQPTVFYAVALALAMIGQGDGLNATIAWAYVILRIIHSLFQSLVNRVVVRFGIFILASLALIALVLHLLIAVFH